MPTLTTQIARGNGSAVFRRARSNEKRAARSAEHKQFVASFSYEDDLKAAAARQASTGTAAPASAAGQAGATKARR